MTPSSVSSPVDLDADVNLVFPAPFPDESGTSTTAPSVELSTWVPDVRLAALPLPADVVPEGPVEGDQVEPMVPHMLPNSFLNSSLLFGLLGDVSPPILMPSSHVVPDGFTLHLRTAPLPLSPVPVLSLYQDGNGANLEMEVHVEVRICNYGTALHYPHKFSLLSFNCLDLIYCVW